ncbi:MAG TPA: GNAT family N-acetyltransferase, partial [Haliangium sp.]|nr:GNAT family N-acetyltransferase [Haliangium sp.]
MSEPIHLTVEDVAAPLARMLFNELDADLLGRYPPSSVHGLVQGAGTLVPTVFLVAWHSEEPIGCAALIDLGGGTAELKRMFVRTRFRNQGIARQLLGAIEQQARELGYTEIRLEAGTRQPEAIALYESSGYTSIPRYKPYDDDPNSVCYA